MDINKIFNELKNSQKEIVDENKEVYKFDEKKFDDYKIGVINNLKENSIYEVYLYVQYNKEVVGGLLLKEFKNIIDATGYFEELLDLANSGNLEQILLKNKVA